MTGDRFGGTALLFDMDGVEYLHLAAFHGDGAKAPHRMHLPVRPKGTPVKPGRITWEYEVYGDTVEVTPSVKVETNDGPGTPNRETFHNEGVWRVKFERFTPLPDLVWDDGIGDHGQRRRFAELNPGVIV